MLERRTGQAQDRSRTAKNPVNELPPHVQRLTGIPKLANRRQVVDSRDLPFRCTMETQNLRPPQEKEIIFSAYGYQETEVCGIDLASKKGDQRLIQFGATMCVPWPFVTVHA